MKILFASDIHGSASACEKVLERVQTEKADRLILMGDTTAPGTTCPTVTRPRRSFVC